MARRRGSKATNANGEDDAKAEVAAMPEPDRAMAERIHAIIRENAPSLSPRTCYGMPAYSKEENLMCFFQGAYKVKTRYATLGFSDKADLHDGTMCPVAYTLKNLTPSYEEMIIRLLNVAIGWVGVFATLDVS